MFVVVLVAACCVVFALWSWMKPRHQSPPMYPGAWPLIGHAYQLAGDPLDFWQFMKNVYHFCLKNGGIAEVRFGPHPVYAITDPDDSLTVANTCLEKPYFYNFGKEMYGTGLVTASGKLKLQIDESQFSFRDDISIDQYACSRWNGDIRSNLLKWKQHRRLLNPAFNLQVLNTFVAEYNKQSRDLVSVLASEVGKDSFNVQRYLVNHLLKTVCHTSLGLSEQYQGMLDKDYSHATEDLFDIFIQRLQKILLHLPYIFNWTSLKRKQDKLIKVTKDIMNKVINKRKLELKARYGLEENTTPTQDKYKPLLDQLLDLADKQDAFTDDEIREHLDTIVAAAYDTTATAMTFTLILMGSYPDMQERIYMEIQTVLDNQDRDFTKEDLPKLMYLEAVLKESVRLYPPAPTVARSIQSDVQLKNYVLPAGSTGLIGVYGINRHPMWGADAEQYKPERWLDPTSLPDNPNAFATFSLGRRNCIGRQYGMMVMKTMLAHIFRKYRVIGDVDSIPTQCDILIKPATSKQIRLELRT